MPSSFSQNAPYFQWVNNVHNCLLALSGLGAEVERVQVKPGGVLIQVREGWHGAEQALPSHVELGGTQYQQVNMDGCRVVWEVSNA